MGSERFLGDRVRIAEILRPLPGTVNHPAGGRRETKEEVQAETAAAMSPMHK